MNIESGADGVLTNMRIWRNWISKIYGWENTIKVYQMSDSDVCLVNKIHQNGGLTIRIYERNQSENIKWSECK